MGMTRILVLAFVVVAAGVTFGSRDAAAFCVNNNSGEALDVFAGQCEGCLRASVKANETLCCPAEDASCQGKVVTFKRETERDAGAWLDCKGETPADGWVVLFADEEDVERAPGGISCRVMDVMGAVKSEGVVSPSHTCPKGLQNAPSAC